MDEIYAPQHNANFWHHLSKVPNYIAPGILGINYDHLFAKGVKHLVFDVDNTLVSFGEPALDPAIQTFLIALKARPEICCIRLASNSIRDLARIKQPLGVTAVQPRLLSFKPLPNFYRRVIQDIHDQPATIAMIGDKLVQDVWGGNYVGLTTVLVQPLGRDNLVDRLLLTRRHERHILRKYLPRHIETWF
jgi:HAD superfamily phosphatase (TIGR01668 family)